MTDPRPALETVLAWLSELDRAESHNGFTYTGWLTRRPVEAIQHLKDNRVECAKS